MARHRTTDNHVHLKGELEEMLVHDIPFIYTGPLIFKNVRSCIDVWTRRAGSALRGKHFCSFIYEDELYIVRVK